MPETPEAAWRRRTRTPALLATGSAWIAMAMASELPSVHMHGTSSAMATMSGTAGMTGTASGSMHRAHPVDVMALVMAGLMVVAMMTPLLIAAVRHVAARSLRSRRTRSVVLLVAVHASLWLAGGVALQVGALWLLGSFGSVVAVLTGVVLALVWETTPIAQRCRNEHHAQPPLAAFGRAADRDVVVFGLEHAAACLGACWALMLLPSLSDRYQGPVLVLCSLWVWAQALETPFPPRWRIPFPTRTGRLLRSRLPAV